MRIVLASASPRRLDLLRSVGVEPEVRPSRADESLLAGEAPATAVRRLALAKAREVASTLAEDALVLGADTLVVVEGVALGKPAGPVEAARMLERLSGRSHEVLTGVAIVRLPGGEEAVAAGRTEVEFRALTAGEIAWYAESGEWADKAGGYAVQGRASVFVHAIRGSWTNVVGLPTELVVALARSLGVELAGR